MLNQKILSIQNVKMFFQSEKESEKQFTNFKYTVFKIINEYFYKIEENLKQAPGESGV
jgi:hypothetical protein